MRLFSEQEIEIKVWREINLWTTSCRG